VNLSKKFCYLLLEILAVASFAGCVQDASNPKSRPTEIPAVAFWIDNKPVTVPEFQIEFAFFLKQRSLAFPQSKDEFVRLIDGCLHEYVEGKVLETESIARSVSDPISGADVAELTQEPIDFPEGFKILEKDRKIWRDRVKKQMVFLETASRISEQLMADYEVEEGDLQTAYDSRKQEFIVPEEFEIREIKVAQKELADQIHARLQDGWDFLKLAAQYSIIRGIGAKGEIYRKAVDDFPEENLKEIRALAKSKFSRVFTYNESFMIYKMEGKIPQRILPFSEVRDTLAQEFRSKERSRRYREWLKAKTDAVEVMPGTPIPFPGVSP
jgi:hypothetical protein